MINVITSLPLLAGFAFGVIIGLALGLIHFGTLKKVSALYLSGTGAGRAIGLQLGRLAFLAVALALLALSGAGPLLGGALGVLAGRTLVLRHAGGAM